MTYVLACRRTMGETQLSRLGFCLFGACRVVERPACTLLALGWLSAGSPEGVAPRFMEALMNLGPFGFLRTYSS